MTNNASLIFDVLANDASAVVLLFGLLLSLLQLLATDRKSNPVKFVILLTVFVCSLLAGLAMLAVTSLIAFFVVAAGLLCLCVVLVPKLAESSPTERNYGERKVLAKLSSLRRHRRLDQHRRLRIDENGSEKKFVAAFMGRKTFKDTEIAASTRTVASIKTIAIVVISAAAIGLAALVLVVNGTALLSVFDAMNLTNRETVIVVSSLLAVTLATVITVLRNPSLMINVAGYALLMIVALLVGEFFLAIDTYVTSYSGQSGI